MLASKVRVLVIPTYQQRHYVLLRFLIAVAMVTLPATLQVLAVVERVSPHIRAQLVMFTYYNPIMRRGAERFCQQAKAAGASGARKS